MKIAATIARIKTAIVQARCKHQSVREWKYADGTQKREIENHAVTGPAFAISDWGEPEPHPVPKFRDILKIQRQRTAHVCHCKSCGKTWVEFGHNQKDVSEQTENIVPFIAEQVAKELKK